MKKLLLTLAMTLFLSIPAYAEWINLSAGLIETDIRSIAADPKDTNTLYAASDKRLYRTTNGGEEWKQILGMRGSQAAIHFVLVDPKDNARIYVASDKGIQLSRNKGKSWENLYRGIGEAAKTVYCLEPDVVGTDALWVGTGEGLLQIFSNSGQVKVVSFLPKIAVYSISSDNKIPSRLWIKTEKGIYKTLDSGQHWQRVQVDSKNSGEEQTDTALSQFQIEELSVMPSAANMVYFPDKEILYAASSRGILRGVHGGDQWAAADNARLPASTIHYLANSSEAVYIATDKGIFQWDEKNGLKDLSDGLESKETRMLVYAQASGDLFAATKKGVFRYPKPEMSPAEITLNIPSPRAAQQILSHFQYEPTIRQVQDAAIEYAEVHPDKIKAWREQASRKAFFPTLSVTHDVSDDKNVDIDRGGTGDADKFIMGPDEKSMDWHAGVSWNLGDLIWNDDQTSIDTRSRLMVELRNDVLTEVTHLYYERRRLQVEMLMRPAKELPLQLEKEIKLEELTAGIDGLTGGYLSKMLSLAETETPLKNQL